MLRQLAKPEVQEMYETISIDTVGIAWDLCEQFIAVQNNVDSVGDIPYGKGWKMLSKEFSDALRKITMLGYGMIIIAHSKTRIEMIDDEHSIEIVEPDIPPRAYKAVNQLVDIIGYIGVEFDEDGKSKRTLYTRSTPTLMAGSRFPHLPTKIPFGYKELTDALVRAIELSGSRDGAVIVDKDQLQENIIPNRLFEEVSNEARQLWTKLVEKDPENANKILDLVEGIFGERKRLSEITEKQKDLYELLIIEMRAM